MIGPPPLPLGVDGTAHAKRIACWSLELDTLPLAERMYLTVLMMFYISNSCYFDLSAFTVEEMRACQNITNVPEMAIPLVV